MIIIKFSSYGTTRDQSPIRLWRGAIMSVGKENEYAKGDKSEGMPTVNVCLESSIVSIKGADLDWFLRAVESPESHLVESNVHKSLPLCGKCFGAGKIDWARKAKGLRRDPYGISPGSSQQIKPIFSGELAFSDDGKKVQQMPKLYDGEGLCPHCGGIGINFKHYKHLFDGRPWYKISAAETKHYKE